VPGGPCENAFRDAQVLHGAEPSIDQHYGTSFVHRTAQRHPNCIAGLPPPLGAAANFRGENQQAFVDATA